MDTAAFDREDLGNRTTVLGVAGELDLSNASELGRRVDEIIEEGFRGVIVDLRRLVHMDSSGLAELIGAQQRTAARDVALVLEVASPGLRRTIEVRGLESLFKIVATRDEALAAVASRAS